MPIRVVDKVLDVPITNHHGRFMAGAYRTDHPENEGRQADHIVLYRNLECRPSLLRINSACYTGDIFHDSRCDCTWQLEKAIAMIAEKDQGLLIYHMHHEGRANGIVDKLRSYAQADATGQGGRSAYEALGVDADARQYQSSIVILRDLGITSVRLVSNSPAKASVLTAAGIEVAELLGVKSDDPDLEQFYRWKRDDFGHHV